MTVPRELFLLDDGRLGSRPVRALEGLRGKPLAQVHGVVVDPDTTGLLREVRGDVLEVVATLRRGARDRAHVRADRAPLARTAANRRGSSTTARRRR